MKLIDAEPLENLLHARVAQCSNDYGSLAGAVSGCLKLVQAQPVITLPPNPPLTLEELREMDGEPVWVCGLNGEGGCWMLVDADYCENGYDVAMYRDYGIEWLAYRRKPEEGKTCQ